MASFPVPFRGRFSLLVLLLAGAMAFAHWKGWLPEDTRPVRPPVAGKPGSGKAREARNAGVWEELQGSVLVENKTNDGDSFEVRHGRGSSTLRLYFVDCPEKNRHLFNGDRIADQGRYFGGLSEGRTVEMGEAARDFSLETLRRQPFTVLTRWERVFDSDRCYAFVTTADGDLAELLVAQGLARIFTKGENRPGGAGAAKAKGHLSKLEREAQISRRGAWGAGQPGDFKKRAAP